MDVEEVEVDFKNNGTFNGSAHTEQYYFGYLESVIYTTLFILFGLMNFCANILVIYTTRRFKKLQLHTRNSYIFHSSTVNAVNLCLLLLQRIIIEIRVLLYFHCILVDLNIMFVFADYLFNTLLGIDWSLEQRRPSQSVKFKRLAHFQILAVYLTVLALYCTFGLSCTYYFGEFLILITVASYVMLLISTATISCLHYCKKRNSSEETLPVNFLALKILTLTAALWVPFFLIGLVWLSVISLFIDYVFLFIGSLPLWKSAINLYVLYTYDKDYRACFVQTFRCKSRKYDDDDQGLDDDDDVDNEATVIYETNQTSAL